MEKDSEGGRGGGKKNGGLFPSGRALTPGWWGKEGTVKRKRKNKTCRFSVSNGLPLARSLHGYSEAAALYLKP